MTVFLAMPAQLTEIQRAVRDRFQEGGSFTAVMLVLLGVAGVVLAAYYLTLRQRRANENARQASPERLFRDLLGKLDLTSHQRQILHTMVSDLRIKHPAVILLSPELFDCYLGEWQVRQHRTTIDEDEQMNPRITARIRRALFPNL